MNDDELKALWQQQPLREPTASAEQLISAMHKHTSQFRSILNARDLRELVACVFVIIVFACFAFFLHLHQPISFVGDWIVVAGSLFTALKLIHTRLKTPPAPPGSTVVESLRAELNSVRAQSQLLGSVLWWYLLPGLIGGLVMTWGSLPIHDPFGLVVMIPANIVVTLFFIVVDVFIYRLNQQARVNQLLPLEAQLESLLHSAETGEPLNETQVANLRPIALSIAAADVQPLEFKVSFWQIALWGEVGFIGIWFCLMLALAMGDENVKTERPPPKTVAQGVPNEETGRFLVTGNQEEKNDQPPSQAMTPDVGAEEAARYFIVARKVVDLLNSRDYAGVQSLYDRGMNEAFPPEKTIEFYTTKIARWGRIEKFDGPTGNGYLGWTAYQLQCEHGELTMSLALDSNDRIAGIYFQPPPIWFPDPVAIVGRVFRWQRLIWIVPFFLAGLYFSHILQKGTDRAVGISTLGIHINKGETLLLWNEIKEIQPLKVLNIRSLWLIRESGEKTIMPWTSLERHAELKSAVEACAPADHPIRKHLSAL